VLNWRQWSGLNGALTQLKPHGPQFQRKATLVLRPFQALFVHARRMPGYAPPSLANRSVVEDSVEGSVETFATLNEAKQLVALLLNEAVLPPEARRPVSSCALWCIGYFACSVRRPRPRAWGFRATWALTRLMWDSTNWSSRFVRVFLPEARQARLKPTALLLQLPQWLLPGALGGRVRRLVAVTLRFGGLGLTARQLPGRAVFAEPSGGLRLGRTCSVASSPLPEHLPALTHERMRHTTQVCQVAVRPIAKLAHGFVRRIAPLTPARVCRSAL
jgi:hypothetical protein